MKEILRRIGGYSIREQLRGLRERNRGQKYGLRWKELSRGVLVEREMYFDSWETRDRYQRGLEVEEGFREILSSPSPKEE